MVSIKIAFDGGLIKGANYAASQHTKSSEKETISLAYGTYQIGKIKDKTYTLDAALKEQQANAEVIQNVYDWKKLYMMVMLGLEVILWPLDQLLK